MGVVVPGVEILWDGIELPSSQGDDVDDTQLLLR